MAPPKRAADSPPATPPPGKKGKQKYDEDVIVIFKLTRFKLPTTISEAVKILETSSHPQACAYIPSSTSIDPFIASGPEDRSSIALARSGQGTLNTTEATPGSPPPVDAARNLELDPWTERRLGWMRAKYNPVGSTSHINTTNLTMREIRRLVNSDAELPPGRVPKPPKCPPGMGRKFRERLDQAIRDGLDDWEEIQAIVATPPDL